MTYRPDYIKVRLQNGSIVKVTELELYGTEAGKKVHIVRRKLCTFLPGVNPEWEARMAAKERAVLPGTIRTRESRARRAQED